ARAALRAGGEGDGRDRHGRGRRGLLGAAGGAGGEGRGAAARVPVVRPRHRAGRDDGHRGRGEVGGVDVRRGEQLGGVRRVGGAALGAGGGGQLPERLRDAPALALAVKAAASARRITPGWPNVGQPQPSRGGVMVPPSGPASSSPPPPPPPPSGGAPHPCGTSSWHVTSSVAVVVVTSWPVWSKKSKSTVMA